MERSKALGLRYTHFPNLNKIVFEDGVCYTMDEAVMAAKAKNADDLRAIHLVKAVFGGTLLKDREGKEEQEKCWFESVPPVCCEIPVQTQNIASVQTQNIASLPPDSEILTLDLWGQQCEK